MCPFLSAASPLAPPLCPAHPSSPPHSDSLVQHMRVLAGYSVGVVRLYVLPDAVLYGFGYKRLKTLVGCVPGVGVRLGGRPQPACAGRESV